MKNIILFLFLLFLISCGSDDAERSSDPIHLYEPAINRCYELGTQFIKVKGIYDNHYFVAYLGKKNNKLIERHYGIIHGNDDDFLNYEVRCNNVKGLL